MSIDRRSYIPNWTYIVDQAGSLLQLQPTHPAYRAADRI